MKIGVVGSSGYIGGLICSVAERLKVDVIKYDYANPRNSDYLLRECNLVFDASLPRSIRDSKNRIEYFKELERRTTISKGIGATYYYIASFSSLSSVISCYGSFKLEAEDIVQEAGGVNLRLGLVINKSNPRGRFQEIHKMMSRVPFVLQFSDSFFPIPLTFESDLVDVLPKLVLNHPSIHQSEIRLISELTSLGTLWSNCFPKRFSVNLGYFPTALACNLIQVLPIRQLDNLKSIAVRHPNET